MSKQISSEHAEVRDLIARTFQQLGGRASTQDIWAHVETMDTDPLNSYLLREGWLRAIGSYLRSSNSDGLPVAPDIGEGVHMDLELFDVDDYRWVIKQQMDGAHARRKRAAAYQARCLEQHGVLIDLDDPQISAA